MKPILNFTVLLSFYSPLFFSQVAGAEVDPCRPSITPEQPQYILGYGSFLQTASRQRTLPSSDAGLPVLISGFERGWFIRGSIYSPTSYLGAIENPDRSLNGAIYRLGIVDEIKASDLRESGYCRKRIEPEQLRLFDQGAVPEGEIWIYVAPPDRIQMPNADYPIVQSYVDLFLGGCLEIQKQFSLTDFGEQCVNTTSGWSAHWVNDRIYPRRPFIYEPQSFGIDQILLKTIPDLLQQRVIE